MNLATMNMSLLAFVNRPSCLRNSCRFSSADAGNDVCPRSFSDSSSWAMRPGCEKVHTPPAVIDEWRRDSNKTSIQADAIAPAVRPGIEDNAIWEWIRVTCRDWWDMIFISVDVCEDLQSCLLQHILHCFSDLCAFYTLVSTALLNKNRNGREDIPDSVLGVAIVTSSVQISQHTSSSPFPAKPPNHMPDFLRFFSKNSTAMRPRTPFPALYEFEDVERCWRTRALTRESIRVSSSTSFTVGKVRSRMSTVPGRMEGKYRWKKMRFKTPVAC